MNKNETKNLLCSLMKTWEDGDLDAFSSFLHNDIMFAIPDKTFNKTSIIKHFNNAMKILSEINIYMFDIIVDGDNFAFEFQFACTFKETNQRSCESVAAIGKISQGKLIELREYWDTKVSEMQYSGKLPLAENTSPLPRPNTP